ncbi:unnamed protein product [Peronospora farinosa]|uniref:Uncharacterized protein n=1 Tax=Peronospora farinosa TaxID=134698 RepID=A0ABN8C3J0_9STRA|nr:unnamed protein product [Peronospora farinosa]
MTLFSTINSLPEFEFSSLNSSSGTLPELILRTFSQYCEYKRTPNGRLLAPNAPEKWRVAFCDEISFVEADIYGTQCVITFLMQLIEQGGFHLGGKNKWVGGAYSVCWCLQPTNISCSRADFNASIAPCVYSFG